MGWTCFQHNGKNFSDIVRNEYTREFKPGVSPGFAVLDFSAQGSVFYAVIERTEVDGGKMFFGLVVLTEKHGSEICIKDMSECMGPYRYGMPLRMLDQLDKIAPVDPNSGAGQWRAECRKQHAAKATRPEAKPGLVVPYGGALYTLTRNLGRRGWIATRNDGIEFRMKCTQVNEGLRELATQTAAPTAAPVAA